MAEIYITGHRNPDMDSICSAIAYADLKNLIDPANTYIPVRCSHMGESMQMLLETLGIEKPVYLRNACPKIADVMLPYDTKIQAGLTLSEYAKYVTVSTPSAVPVFDGEEFCGLLSVDDIAVWAMKNLADRGTIHEIPCVRELMGEQGERLQADSLFEEGKNAFLNSRFRGLAVFHGEEFVGYVTRRCFLNTPAYNVILVDHNEMGQSIKGVETANVLEIIDHHRLNAMKTTMPLFVDAEPLGSTCTIVYQLFLRNGIRPAQETARVLLTGILSDTLILKSPTTTQTDIESAAALAARCQMSVDEYGKKMFSNIRGLKNREPVSAITGDFKLYSEKGLRIGIGQCEVTTLHDLSEFAVEYLNALETVKTREGLDWALLMITDVIAEQSVLLSTDFYAEKHLPYSPESEHIFDMPKVMSRKKQLLPEVLNALY